MPRWVPAVLVLLSTSPASGQGRSDVPIIEAGREDEVVDLFAPYRLTGEISGGYRLMNIRIEATRIVCDVRGPDDQAAVLRLDHPDDRDAGTDGRSASFAMTFEAPDAAARGALEHLSEAVRENDGGGFFRVRARPPANLGQRVFERRDGPAAWLLDGVVISALGLLVLLWLGVRQLREDGRIYAAALAGIVVGGAIVRLLLSPNTVLGAWPFSRSTTLMRIVWEGPLLANVSSLARLDYFDVATTTTLLFSFVTPVAVYAHGRRLLGDPKIALAAAGLIAVLPNHIRFSHSEVAFIPSIAISSTTFYVLHVALKDPSARIRRLAFCALPLLATGTFLARPLNQLFLPLLLVTALYLARTEAPRARRLVSSLMLCLVAVATTALHFSVYYADQAREGLSLTVLWSGVAALFSFKHDTLLNPWITPPLVLAAAVAGPIFWLRRRDPTKRDLVLFLVLWLLSFFISHAYVLPASTAMQARYHLHLAVPFAFLAAIGIVEVLARWRRLGIAVAAYAALSPVVHADFISDVEFNDQREYAFLREHQHLVPNGCTVLEYTGRGDFDQDARFLRIGSSLAQGREERRFVARPIGSPVGWEDPVREEIRALLDGSSPECLVYYEGLFCYGRKEPGEPLAPTCAAMREAVPLRRLANTRFESRVYDGNLGAGIAESAEVELGLYRIR